MYIVIYCFLFLRIRYDELSLLRINYNVINEISVLENISYSLFRNEKLIVCEFYACVGYALKRMYKQLLEHLCHEVTQ